jgi:hypothetical protein
VLYFYCSKNSTRSLTFQSMKCVLQLVDDVGEGVVVEDHSMGGRVLRVG